MKIKEFCIINNSTISQKVDCEILYLDTSSITNNEIEGYQSFMLSKAPSRAQRKVQDKTILYSCVRPNLRHFGILKNPPSNLVVSTGFATLDVKDECVVDPYYLYYWLSQESITNTLHTIAQNAVSSYPSINPSDIGDLEIDLPPINIQRKIGAFLDSLDRKISLNRSINAKLERMAKEIYDYWFVQFEFPRSVSGESGLPELSRTNDGNGQSHFPDEHGRPYKSSGGAMVYNPVLKREVPEGWEVKDLDYFLSSVSERTSQIEDSHANYTPIEVIPRKKMSFFETAPLEKAVSGLCKYKRKDILLSNRRVYFHKVSIVPFNGVTRDTVIILRPNLKDTLEYSFQLVNSEHFIAFATKHSYGSEQPVLSWETARKYKVCAPPKDIVLSYSKKISSCIDSILDNEIESGELTKLRDELLPLLMTGQVKIK